MEYFESLYAKYGISPQGKFVIFTDPGKPNLESQARDKGIEVRYIQPNAGTDVGGRYTAPTTNVFLLPLAVLRSKEVVDDTLLKKSGLCHM